MQIEFPRRRKQGADWHPLVQMRDAKVAHEILARSGHGLVRMCHICQRHETSCPYKGEESYGECPSFVLDEEDISATEQRMLDCISGILPVARLQRLAA